MSDGARQEGMTSSRTAASIELKNLDTSLSVTSRLGRDASKSVYSGSWVPAKRKPNLCEDSPASFDAWTFRT